MRIEFLDRLIIFIIKFLGDNKFIIDHILKSLFNNYCFEDSWKSKTHENIPKDSQKSKKYESVPEVTRGNKFPDNVYKTDVV